jgi:hypothetical protein
MSTPDPDWTLHDARQWLRDRVDDGARCPCCTQHAKVYRRKITGAMARALIALHQAGGADEYVYAPDILREHRLVADAAKLRYWHLVTELDEPRDDGGRAGYWQITPHGVHFLRGDLRVPKYARVYDGRRLGFTGEPVSVGDCLGEPFRLDELMAGV